MHTKDLENYLADKAAVKTKFCKVRTDMQAKNDWIQSSLNGKVARANAYDSKCVSLFVSEKELKRQLQLMSQYSQEVEDLKYRLDGAVAEAHRSQTIIGSLQEQSLSVWYNGFRYSQSPPLCTERLTADVTDSFSVFL